MIEQLISRVFYARNLAHYEHWRTESYAQHKALGKFYEGVIEALDALVEAYQGLNGLIGSIPSPTDTKGDSMKILKADAEWIEANHEEISGGNSAIANLTDNVTGIYLSTIYKLENLR
jgi:hypothetical protein